MSTFLSQERVVNYLSPVRLVANSNVSGTYNNGQEGLGATITTGSASLTIDSVAVVDNDRVLLQAQTNNYENGIYVVSGVGSDVVLTRADDFQTTQQMSPGQTVSVEAGTEFGGGVFGMVEPRPSVIGTDNIPFNNAASTPSSLTLDNDGLQIYNPAGTFLTSVVPTDAITADRQFSIDINDADRTLTFNGDATLDQDVDTTASPQFVDIDAGASGTAGTVDSFPATAANGKLIFAAQNNSGGDFDTTIQNAASVGQDQVISIPDSGAASANFLLDDGANNILSMQQFLGIESVITFGTGTWTATRVAQGDYVMRHTEGDETSIIAVDVTPAIRTAASKGFRLDSFDYIYAINDDTLDAHSVVLDRIEYADNVAVSVNSVPVTGSLATATQANPYVTNISVDSPAFDNVADSKYVIEITANNSATSEYDFIGVMLRFSRTIA